MILKHLKFFVERPMKISFAEGPPVLETNHNNNNNNNNNNFFLNSHVISYQINTTMIHLTNKRQCIIGLSV